MEPGGGSPAGSSQQPPGLMSELPASAQPAAGAGDLSAPGEGEGVSSICERVVTGLKNLTKEREKLYRVRAELKRLKKQRGLLHSQRRGSIDSDIQLVRSQVEQQEAIVAALEGKDGPFREKFLNERRFHSMADMEVEEESAGSGVPPPSSDLLPPQRVTSSPGPSQGSGGMLQVIRSMESPIREDRMVFGDDDIPEDMPDKVKPARPQTVFKTVFVSHDNTMSSNVSVPAVSDNSPCNSTVSSNVSVPAVSDNKPSCNVSVPAVSDNSPCNSTMSSNVGVPAVSDNLLSSNVSLHTVSDNKPSSSTVSHVSLPAVSDNSPCSNNTMSSNVSVPAVSDTSASSSTVYHACVPVKGNVVCRDDSPAEGQQGSAGPIDSANADPPACPVGEAQRVSMLPQQVVAGTAGSSASAAAEAGFNPSMSNIPTCNSVTENPDVSFTAVNNVPVCPDTVWSIGSDKPTFAQVVRSAPGSVIRPGSHLKAHAISRQTAPPQPATSRAPLSGPASLPAAASRRRNVVLLKWEGGSVSPARRVVVELILGMGFVARDIFALIHVAGTREYTISFTRPEGLDLFWERYEAQCRSRPDWEGLTPVAVSQRSTVKKITIILSNESIPACDLEVWLRNYGEVLTSPAKIYDEHHIWTGGWSVTVRLARVGNVVRHLPSSAFIGRDRMTVFYPGQPKLCHRCGERGHFSSSCPAVVCSMCRAQGHMAKDCTEIRCNLCLRLGHPYSQCPEAWHNMEREVVEDLLRLDRDGATSSTIVAGPPGPIQGLSSAPVVIPSVALGPPPMSVSTSSQPPVSALPVSVPSVSVPPESVCSESPPPVSVPSVSVPPESVPSHESPLPVSVPSGGKEGQISLQKCIGSHPVEVAGGTQQGVSASSAGKSLKKSAKKNHISLDSEVVHSEADLQYLTERRKVGKQKRRQAARVEETPLPTSNRFSSLSRADVSLETEMEIQEASRKREASEDSGDEQQRGAKKQSTQ